MNFIRKPIILILLTFICLIIFHWKRTGEVESEIESSKSAFYYMPNDTHCPTAVFAEKETQYFVKTDTCVRETGDWIIVENNFALFNDTVITEIGNINCVYKSIIWTTDFESTLSPSWNPFFNNTYLGADILLVHCKGQSLFHYYEQYLFGFETKSKFGHGNSLQDILIVGIDSISRLAFRRLLKRTQKYLETDINESTVIFKKMNVLGDGTTVNVMGLLAGVYEMESYESRKGYANAKNVDEYPWIWKLMKFHGYSTYYDEDDCVYGTFQYRLLGFREKPTDFYSRTWRMIQENRKRASLCMNHRNLFQDQLQNVQSFFQTAKSPKFGFVFTSHFSHNVNEEAVLLDESLLEFLKKFTDPDGIFNNTILVLMSDHGHRFNSRFHLQGKFEERLPFLAINLPNSLIKNRPDVLRNLRINENKLITAFDVYESLKDVILNFTSNENRQSMLWKMSLFNPDLPLRKCEDIKVEPHWCSCLKWTEIDKDQRVVRDAAAFLVSTINNITEEYQTLCQRLELDKVLRVHSIAPSTEVLKFRDSGPHGRMAHMSDNTKVTSANYRISILTKPGDAVFESTIKINEIDEKVTFSINIQDIDRSNQYQKWIWCIVSGMKDVRKFCLCQ